MTPLAEIHKARLLRDSVALRALPATAGRSDASGSLGVKETAITTQITVCILWPQR
jgi:hypothetical protein